MAGSGAIVPGMKKGEKSIPLIPRVLGLQVSQINAPHYVQIKHYHNAALTCCILTNLL